MIAEGKMLRAMIYFNKARLFGKFVLIDKVLTPEDELQLGRSKTIKETYDFILKDLKDAASGLPENAENGYFTKGAALALKAEVALHGASYIETGKEDYYKEVKTSSEELFKLGYSLDSDYKKMFNDYDYASNSKEIIFALWRNKSVTQYKDTQCNNLHQMQRLMCCMTLHGLSLNRIFWVGETGGLHRIWLMNMR